MDDFRLIENVNGCGQRIVRMSLQHCFSPRRDVRYNETISTDCHSHCDVSDRPYLFVTIVLSSAPSTRSICKDRLTRQSTMWREKTSTTKVNINKTRPDRHEGDVSHPQLVGACCCKFSVNQTSGTSQYVIRNRRPALDTSLCTLYFQSVHQTFNGTARNLDTLPVKLAPGFGGHHIPGSYLPRSA